MMKLGEINGINMDLESRNQIGELKWLIKILAISIAYIGIWPALIGGMTNSILEYVPQVFGPVAQNLTVKLLLVIGLSILIAPSIMMLCKNRWANKLIGIAWIVSGIMNIFMFALWLILFSCLFHHDCL